MNDGFQQALAQLRQGIDVSGPAPGPERERLLALVAQLEAQLEAAQTAESEGDEAGSDGALTPLREAVEHFEAEHPKLTALMIEVMRSLGGAGI